LPAVSERGQKRRRLREQRRLREAMLLDLGALVYELHRQGRRAPELLQQKAAELTVVDDEVRELQAELDGVEPDDTPAEETAEVDAIADEDEDGEPPLDDEDPLDDEEHDEPEDQDEPVLAEHEEPRA
jgi:hypothetical protein